MGKSERRDWPAAGMVEADIEEVRARIGRWRRTRKTRGMMPAELWAAAVALAESRDVYPVARALKLNYDTLRARVLEAELARRPERCEETRVEFVELGAAPVFGGVNAAESVVELVRANGDRMTVRLPAGVDVVGLAEAFWGPRP